MCDVYSLYDFEVFASMSDTFGKHRKNTFNLSCGINGQQLGASLVMTTMINHLTSVHHFHCTVHKDYNNVLDPRLKNVMPLAINELKRQTPPLLLGFFIPILRYETCLLEYES